MPRPTFINSEGASLVHDVAVVAGARVQYVVFEARRLEHGDQACAPRRPPARPAPRRTSPSPTSPASDGHTQHSTLRLCPLPLIQPRDSTGGFIEAPFAPSPGPSPLRRRGEGERGGREEGHRRPEATTAPPLLPTKVEPVTLRVRVRLSAVGSAHEEVEDTDDKLTETDMAPPSTLRGRKERERGRKRIGGAQARQEHHRQATRSTQHHQALAEEHQERWETQSS